MDQLFDMPSDYLEPLLLCFEVLDRCNYVIFAKEKSFWKTYWRSFFIIPCVAMYNISLTFYLTKLYSEKLSIVTLSLVVSIYVVCVQATLKVLIVTINMKKIRALIVELGRIWAAGDLTEQQINKRNALVKKLKLFVSVFYRINIMGAWQYMTAPLLETIFRKFILHQECGMLLPFSCSFPFDPTANWLRYLGVYLFEAYSMFRVAYYHLSTELLMTILCSHISTQFALLSDAMKNYNPDDDDSEEGTNGTNNKGIKRIIARHQILLRLAEELDDIFNKLIFVNLASATITISFFAFSAKVARTKLDIGNNFMALVALTFPIFYLCYYGELLIQTSSSMAEAAYEHLWYKRDIKYQALICFIIKRSQQPCCLTSLKMAPIALCTFTKVLSSTWSYFSLASSMYESQD